MVIRIYFIDLQKLFFVDAMKNKLSANFQSETCLKNGIISISEWKSESIKKKGKYTLFIKEFYHLFDIAIGKITIKIIK